MKKIILILAVMFAAQISKAQFSITNPGPGGNPNIGENYTVDLKTTSDGTINPSWMSASITNGSTDSTAIVTITGNGTTRTAYVPPLSTYRWTPTNNRPYKNTLSVASHTSTLYIQVIY
jgi:hypothetical protein